MALTSAQNKTLNSMKSTLKSLSAANKSMTSAQRDKVSGALTKASGVVSNIAKSSSTKGQKDVSPVLKAGDIGAVPANVPTPPVKYDPGTLTLDSAQGTTLVGNQYQAIPPMANDTLDASNNRQTQNFGSYMQGMLGLKPQENQGMNDYAKMERQMQIQRKQDAVNQYTGTLNSIIATRDQNLEQLRGTGSQYGVTEAVYGGQQQEINREAYIKAAPVQAQLAAAQGDLEMAQARLDKLFTIHQQDVKATHDYNVSMVQSLYQFMDKQETNRANQLIAREGQKYQEKQNNINYLRTLSAQAIQNGNTSVIGQLGAIDPNSPTFEADVARVARGIVAPRAASSGISAPTVKTINGVDMQWNSSTGMWETIAGGNAVNEQKQQQINETLGLARQLLSDNTAGKSGAVGFGFQKFVPFGLSLGLQGDRASFENKVNTLKANLTLDNLSLLKGPMSDKDLAFLQAIGSSLTTNMSESEFNKEIKKVIVKLEEKVAPATLSGGKVITAPDGTQIEIID